MPGRDGDVWEDGRRRRRRVRARPSPPPPPPPPPPTPASPLAAAAPRAGRGRGRDAHDDAPAGRRPRHLRRDGVRGGRRGGGGRRRRRRGRRRGGRPFGERAGRPSTSPFPAPVPRGARGLWDVGEAARVSPRPRTPRSRAGRWTWARRELSAALEATCAPGSFVASVDAAGTRICRRRRRLQPPRTRTRARRARGIRRGRARRGPRATCARPARPPRRREPPCARPASRVPSRRQRERSISGGDDCRSTRPPPLARRAVRPAGGREPSAWSAATAAHARGRRAQRRCARRWTAPGAWRTRRGPRTRRTPSRTTRRHRCRRRTGGGVGAPPAPPWEVEERVEAGHRRRWSRQRLLVKYAGGETFYEEMIVASASSRGGDRGDGAARPRRSTPAAARRSAPRAGRRR